MDNHEHVKRVCMSSEVLYGSTAGQVYAFIEQFIIANDPCWPEYLPTSTNGAAGSSTGTL